MPVDDLPALECLARFPGFFQEPFPFLLDLRVQPVCGVVEDAAQLVERLLGSTLRVILGPQLRGVLLDPFS